MGVPEVLSIDASPPLPCLKAARNDHLAAFFFDKSTAISLVDGRARVIRGLAAYWAYKFMRGGI